MTNPVSYLPVHPQARPGPAHKAVLGVKHLIAWTYPDLVDT